MNSYHTQIGKALKLAREELALSLTDASTALHIRAHYLQALESGDLSVLPGTAYTKGYLITYSTFLRLDKDEIIRRFEMVEEELPTKGMFLPQVFSNEKSPDSTVVWCGVGLALLAYIVWYFTYSPKVETISLVEQPPSVAEVLKEYHIPGSVFNLPCATPAVKLYPACYRIAPAKPKNKGAGRKKSSIMELAN